MQSCVPSNLAQYFYSWVIFIILSICSLFTIFADSVIYFSGYDCLRADIIIWVIIPIIIVIFIIEYLMICKLFSCPVFNITMCDAMYVFSILSLVVELTRITPEMKQFNYYSLDENHESYHIDNITYWKHKLFDSFIEFVIILRVVQSILRAVLFYIYGKEHRQHNSSKNIDKKQSQTSNKKDTKRKPKEKNGYHETSVNEPISDDDYHEIEGSNYHSHDHAHDNNPDTGTTPNRKKRGFKCLFIDETQDNEPQPNV